MVLVHCTFAHYHLAICQVFNPFGTFQDMAQTGIHYEKNKVCLMIKVAEDCKTPKYFVTPNAFYIHVNLCQCQRGRFEVLR